MAGKRSVGDWIWLMVLIGGISCIAIAGWMFVSPRIMSPATAEKEVEAKAKKRFQALVRRAKKEIEEKDWKGAVADLTAALSMVDLRNRGTAELRYDLGLALQRDGKSRKAIPELQWAIALCPTRPEPYLELGRIYEAGGQLAPAYAHLRAGLALHPDPVPADLLASVKELAAKLEAPRKQRIAKFRDELRANPANTDVLAMLITAQLARTKVGQDAAPDEGIRKAVLAAGRGLGGLPALIATQKSAVEARPKSMLDRAGLANLLLLSGNWKEAKRVAGEAIGLSSMDSAPRLAASLADLFAGATDDGNLVVATERLGRHDALVWMALGAYRIREGNTHDAQVALSQAFGQDPATAEVYRLFALALTDPKEAASRKIALRAWMRLTR